MASTKRVLQHALQSNPIQLIQNDARYSFTEYNTKLPTIK